MRPCFFLLKKVFQKVLGRFLIFLKPFLFDVFLNFIGFEQFFLDLLLRQRFEIR